MARQTRHEWMRGAFTWYSTPRRIQRAAKLDSMDVMHSESDLGYQLMRMR